jgi:hypothetical protein
MLRRVAAARGLEPKRDVEEIVLRRPALIERLRAHVTRVVPQREIAGEGLFLQMLGVLGPEEDYEKLVYATLDQSMAGMYEPLDQKMYVPDDLSAEALRRTTAHELGHALADQYFGLGKREEWIAGAGDTMVAWSCLAEGDATLASERVVGEAGPVPAEGGSYIERELMAPYMVGTAFVRTLFEHGGWAEVNDAWARDGLTTEQVLHPEKWAAHEPALVVPTPSVDALGASTVVWTDVRGELALRLVLSADAATGWGGDSVVIAKAGSSMAMAWRIRFDDEPHARTAQAAMTQAFSARACHLSRKDRDVLALFGLPRDVCSRWAKAILVPSAP